MTDNGVTKVSMREYNRLSRGNVADEKRHSCAAKGHPVKWPNLSARRSACRAEQPVDRFGRPLCSRRDESLHELFHRPAEILPDSVLSIAPLQRAGHLLNVKDQ
jgi:hypothetical protein